MVEVPDGNGAADSIDTNSCGYDTELIGLEDGCYLSIAWPTSLNSNERDHLESVWEEDSYDGWEDLGWMLDDTEVWFWGDLDIELIDEVDAKVENSFSSPKGVTVDGLTDWFPANIKPIRDGYYDIELLSPRVRPFMPIDRAKWNGRAWLDDSGEKLKIRCWRGLLNKSEIVK